MDIVVVFVGWAFLFYLNNRTLKRAEIQKLKDSSITFLEQLIQLLYVQLVLVMHGIIKIIKRIK